MRGAAARRPLFFGCGAADSFSERTARTAEIPPERGSRASLLVTYADRHDSQGRLGIGAQPHRRAVRPVLLLLVFGAFLVIVGATASGQALLVTPDASSTLLNATVSVDAAAVRSFVDGNLTIADLSPGGPTAARRELLECGRIEHLHGGRI